MNIHAEGFKMASKNVPVCECSGSWYYYLQGMTT